ncbi:MAG: homoserine kinase [Endomicrobium sp.]|jgi:homoserine kinase|nr:homoserine kinase [Endomicrobium sp.]
MKVKVKVPATTANLGPGFDVFGAALSMYNEFEAEYVPKTKKTHFILRGIGKKYLAGGENLFLKSMQKTFAILGEDKYSLKNLNVVVNTGIPLSGGLGSSASAIVGGVVVANILCGNKLDKTQVADLAVKIEGHPDNVIPALYGGICLCSKDNGNGHGTVIQLPVPNLKVVLCVPSFELRTKKSRQILPKSADLQDVVFNISRVALLTAAFCCSDFSLLRDGTQDKIHQPYRSKMIPSMNEVLESALSAGAYGAFLSGAGPSLAAFCSSKNAVNVQKNMLKRWRKGNSVRVKSYILDFDVKGTVVM